MASEVEIYLYSNCTGCKKADAFLRMEGIPARRRDLFKHKLSAVEIRSLFERAEITVQDAFSTRSKPYQDLQLAEKALSDDEIIELMAEYPALIRRPLLLSAAGTLIGFNQSAYESLAATFRQPEGDALGSLEFGSHVSAAGGVDLAINRAAALGMTTCQIFTKNERQWKAKPLDPVVVERFKANWKTTGLKQVVAHDSYLINIASPDDLLWERSRDALAHELERCDQLGVPYLVSHPGAHVGTGVDAGVARVALAINQIHAAHPDGGAIVLIETTAGQGSALGSTFEEIAAIIDQLEDKSRIGVCLDTCHIFAAGYDIRDAESYAATMERFDEIIGLDRLQCLHLNDSQKGLGSHVDRHAHIGQGEIGPAAFGFIVNDPRLAGLPGILETPKDDAGEEDGMNLATLNGLIAREETPVVS